MFELFRKQRLSELNTRYLQLIEQARERLRRGEKHLYRQKLEEAEVVANVIDRIKSY